MRFKKLWKLWWTLIMHFHAKPYSKLERKIWLNNFTQSGFPFTLLFCQSHKQSQFYVNNSQISKISLKSLIERLWQVFCKIFDQFCWGIEKLFGMEKFSIFASITRRSLPSISFVWNVSLELSGISLVRALLLSYLIFTRRFGRERVSPFDDCHQLPFTVNLASLSRHFNFYRSTFTCKAFSKP